MVEVFANDLRNWSLIPGRVITKTQKVVLDVSLLNTQHYEVQIKGKWINLSVVAIEKEAFRSPLTMVG